MLKVNTVLKHVVLRNNQIGDEGAVRVHVLVDGTK